MPDKRVASFSSLPNETVDRIAYFVAVGVSTGNEADRWELTALQTSYRTLCSLRLVNKSCNDSATPQLLRWVSLNRHSNSTVPIKVDPIRAYWYKPDLNRSIGAFAALASSNPSSLHSVNYLRCCFHVEDRRRLCIRDVKAETTLLPAFANMSSLRRAYFGPYINASAFFGALHPDARLKVLRTLAPPGRAGPVLLDGPQLEGLNQLALNLDGDIDPDTIRGSRPTRTIELHLPPSLSILELETLNWYSSPLVLSLSRPIPRLGTVQLQGRSLSFAAFEPFFRIQGPFITSLVLIASDLFLAVQLEPTVYPPEYNNPNVRNDYLATFNEIVPVVALCTQLRTLEIYDVHLGHLFRTQGHPTLETVVLQVEPSVSRLLWDDWQPEDLGDGPELWEDNFGKVSFAIQHIFERVRFPEMTTIEYKDAKWDEITAGQAYANEHQVVNEQVDDEDVDGANDDDEHRPYYLPPPRGLRRSVAAAGLVLLDARGKEWKDEMAGWEYEEEEDGSDEEEEDEVNSGSDEETEWFDAREEAVEDEGENDAVEA